MANYRIYAGDEGQEEWWDKLPENWQNTVDHVVDDMVGEDLTVMAQAFRRYYAKYWSELEQPEVPGEKETAEIGDMLAHFLNGWSFALLSLDHMANPIPEVDAQWNPEQCGNI